MVIAGFLNYQQYDTLPHTNGLYLKMDGKGIRPIFNFGARPIFKGELLVRFSFMKCFPFFFWGGGGGGGMHLLVVLGGCLSRNNGNWGGFGSAKP